MKFGRVTAIVAVVLMIVPAAVAIDVPASDAAKDGRSMANAIPVDIQLEYQETDVRLINTNLQLFDFVQP